MARSRNIKPGFFTNDSLAELPALTRLLFIGLWTLVDRAGRIEDRPKKIKAECMPYDDMDADAAIQSLADSGFLLRYEAQGVRCIQVLNWDKHQNPHVKEAASTIPAHAEHQTSTRQAPDKEQPKPERAGLIPSSLIPDSLPPSKTKTARKRAAPAVLVSLADLVAEGCDEQSATDWLIARKSKGLPLTPTAWADTKAEAIKARMSPGEAVKAAACNGWGGFKASWLQEPARASPASFASARAEENAKWIRGTSLDRSMQFFQEADDAAPIAIR